MSEKAHAAMSTTFYGSNMISAFHRAQILRDSVRRLTPIVCILLGAAFRPNVPILGQNRADASLDIQARYEKYEYRIPMRDGAHLYTAVYVPRDTSAQYPILLKRTRYGVRHYGSSNFHSQLGPGLGFDTRSYIFAMQDVRGMFMSDGHFVDMTPHIATKKTRLDVDEQSDTYDTVEWLVNHVPRNSGRVGLWGISYDGFYAAAGLIDAHPAIVAVSPQAPQADWFGGDDVHLNGAFVLDAFNYFSAWGRPRPAPSPDEPQPIKTAVQDGYRFYLGTGALPNFNTRYFREGIPIWNDCMEHGTNDAYWKARNYLQYLRGVKPAVMAVSGWYDANNLYGALNVYKTVERTNPQAFNILVIGPWWHGQWSVDQGESAGDVSFGSPTSTFFGEKIETPFFDAFLKHKEPPNLPEAYLFETGTNRWRTFDTWPPREVRVRSLYLRENGGLAFNPPGAGQLFDEYVSDPAKPVPYVERSGLDRNRDYMIQDQRFAASRPDVLVYTTTPLAEDITIAGPVSPRMWVSTTGTDSDWVVKLIDVYPDDAKETAAPSGTGALRPGQSMAGYQQLVRADVMRGKFRNSLERPEPFLSGKPTSVAFTM